MKYFYKNILKTGEHSSKPSKSIEAFDIDEAIKLISYKITKASSFIICNELTPPSEYKEITICPAKALPENEVVVHKNIALIKSLYCDVDIQNEKECDRPYFVYCYWETDSNGTFETFNGLKESILNQVSASYELGYDIIIFSLEREEELEISYDLKLVNFKLKCDDDSEITK